MLLEYVSIVRDFVYMFIAMNENKSANKTNGQRKKKQFMKSKDKNQRRRWRQRNIINRLIMPNNKLSANKLNEMKKKEERNNQVEQMGRDL